MIAERFNASEMKKLINSWLSLLYKMSISHYRKSVVKHYGRNRKTRAKTFQSVDAAKKYADANGIKAYELVTLGLGMSSKIKIVQK
jgi:hypothetical protein